MLSFAEFARCRAVGRSAGEGRRINEIAGGLQLSRETVRNPLKIVFAKTGAHR
jgi:DNA-binding CsgD family transcriptional regulator